jgi:DNA polymerase
VRVITLDWETYYDRHYSLSKMTTQEYIMSEKFEVILVGVQIDDLPGRWFSGTHEQIASQLSQLPWGELILLGQNTMFDAAILAWRFGIHPARLADTLCMSRALYPHEKSHSLAAQAKREGLEAKGTEVSSAIGKRRIDFTADELKAYGRYCVKDCRLTKQLFNIYMEKFPRQELLMVDLTLKCFTQGAMHLDKQGLKDHLTVVEAEKESTISQAKSWCGDSGMSDTDLGFTLRSSTKFAAVLEQLGVPPPMKISPTTGKPTHAFAKTDAQFQALLEHDNPAVQALASARLASKSTIEETRTQRLIDAANITPLLPVALRYYGAHTGRWSGDKAGANNFQNLPRGSQIKSCVVAPPGWVIAGGDLSNIELRLGLYEAGQEDKIELVRKGLDLYKDQASKNTPFKYAEVPAAVRQAYKVVCLSAIYATGWAKLKETLRVQARQDVSESEAKSMIYGYRDDNPQVVQAWEDCEGVLRQAISGRDGMELFDGMVRWDAQAQGFLLPSGLHLQMPNIRFEYDEKGRQQMVFDGKHGTEKIYGGKCFQGLTQALARCVIAAGWRRIHRRYQVVASVHDSLYWLVPEQEAEEGLLWGMKEMVKPLAWCAELPLNAEGVYGKTLKGESRTYKV